MSDNSPIAVLEMIRLQGCSAWSPCSKVIKRQRNQACSRYTFEDGSQLTIYFNGDASWFHRDKNGCTSGEQRWQRWHSCNV